jgi:hypothetical protein
MLWNYYYFFFLQNMKINIVQSVVEDYKVHSNLYTIIDSVYFVLICMTKKFGLDGCLLYNKIFYMTCQRTDFRQ